MVRGRLPRESNPVPGQSQPGFVPAFDETGNEDYVRVSNQKPYPVANYTQNPSGVWLPTSQNNPMPTQLTGSNVELISYVENVDVPTGTVVRFSQNIDISKYKKIFIQITPTGSSTYRLYYFPLRFEEDIALLDTVVFTNESGTSNRVTDEFNVRSLGADFGIRNDGEIDHQFGRIGVFGVRS